MNLSADLSPHYKRPTIVAAVASALLMLLSAMVLDGGATALATFCAIVGIWTAIVLIVARRPQLPTKADIDVIRFGPIMAMIAAQFLARLIWYLRGEGLL